MRRSFTAPAKSNPLPPYASRMPCFTAYTHARCFTASMTYACCAVLCFCWLVQVHEWVCFACAWVKVCFVLRQLRANASGEHPRRILHPSLVYHPLLTTCINLFLSFLFFSLVCLCCADIFCGMFAFRSSINPSLRCGVFSCAYQKTAQLSHVNMQTYYVYLFHSHSYLGTVRAESLEKAQAILDRSLIVPCIVTDEAPLDLSSF